MAALFGPANPNWKGGSWINSSGYRMILVGVDHPVANCRQYAPEHLVVYYDYHGELPGPGWHVHHHDLDKQNNDIANLEPTLHADHSRRHLPKGSRRARELGRLGGQATAQKKRSQ